MGLVISPSSWHRGGFTLSDTLHFLNFPYTTVSLEKVDNSLFFKADDFFNKNVIESYENALEALVSKFK